MAFPTHIHTVYSQLDGIIKMPKLVKKCKELGYTACSITDHGGISGAFDFIQECLKQEIKPIVGSEFYVCRDHSFIKNEDNRKLAHMVLLAKNKSGYFELVKLTSLANKVDSYYYKPRLSLNEIKQYCSNLVAFSGHPGSVVGNALCGSDLLSCTSLDEGYALLDQNRLDAARDEIRALQSVFGENLYLEIQLFYTDGGPGFICLAETLRKLGKELGVKCIACMDAHYLDKCDAKIQRIALCSSLKLKIKEISEKIAAGEQVPLESFFTSDTFYLLGQQELLDVGNTQEEIDNLTDIENSCEAYSLNHPPRLPKFSNDGNDYETLVKLCRDGWTKRINNTWDKQIYGDRVKKELKVIKRTDLSPYFLIIADYVNYMKNKGWLVGSGRGSISGSLVAYLLAISEIDSIKYDLVFERFFNPGRCYSKHISFDEYKYLEDFVE